MADLQVYVIRHGLAEARGDAWPDDTKRPLSEDGIAGLRQTGRALRLLDVSFGVILSSPLVRARQTAEILAAAGRPAPPIVIADSLAPGGAHTAIVKAIAAQARRAPVAIVGHEPGLGECTARFLGLPQPLALKKGSITCIDFDRFSAAATGQLRWLLPPKVLRALARGR